MKGDGIMSYKIIEKGTKYCKSQLGHNNFVYPNMKDVFEISEECKASQLHWIPMNGLTPFHVKKNDKNFIIWIEV